MSATSEHQWINIILGGDLEDRLRRYRLEVWPDEPDGKVSYRKIARLINDAIEAVVSGLSRPAPWRRISEAAIYRWCTVIYRIETPRRRAA